MDTMGKKEIPIGTFDAMLRDLVTWDLVVPGEGDDARAWHLVARAQQRMGELMIARGPWPAEHTVYLDRLCADCGRRQLTWARDGAYVCDPCWQKRLTRVQDEPATVALAEEPGTTDMHRSDAECQRVGDVACASNRSVGLDRSGQATRRSSLFSICSAWSLNLRFSPAKNPKRAYASSAVPPRATPVSVTPTQP
jgi:hypothetical protein